jgi:hypothetical protein
MKFWGIFLLLLLPLGLVVGGEDSSIAFQESKAVVVMTHQGEKITFPAGEISWADAVVSYKVGDPAPAEKQNSKAALGRPDHAAASKDPEVKSDVVLGHGGELVLQFTDNVLVDVPGPDLVIFEVGQKVEPTDVAISTNGKTWIKVGQAKGATSKLDIGPVIKAGEKFRFVKLTDAKAGLSNKTKWPGADIDAVGCIGCEPIPKKNADPKDEARERARPNHPFHLTGAAKRLTVTPGDYSGPGK